MHSATATQPMLCVLKLTSLCIEPDCIAAAPESQQSTLPRVPASVPIVLQAALKDDGRVLIHCSQGVSRSTTLLIAFLMWRSDQAYDEIFQQVKASRGVANPNIGFICQVSHEAVVLQPSVMHNQTELSVCASTSRMICMQTRNLVSLMSCNNHISAVPFSIWGNTATF